jgi:hypothetical protein
MRTNCRCDLLISMAMFLRALSAASTALGYATGDGDGNKLSHQWITLQGWELFRSQFGPSEIDNFLGQPTRYPTEAKALVMEGVFAEDETARNPWDQGAIVGPLNHPSLRHFWTPNADFSRSFAKGLQATVPGTFPPVTVTFDSAANRGVKYFTGGRDVVGGADDGWDDRGDAALDQGIVQFYSLASTRERAFYYLGHVTHLLQDLTLPAHSQGDQHLEVGSAGVGVNPDPLHDWADGIEFSSSILQNPTRIAAFDDLNPTRYQRWKFVPASGGVGRPENPASVLTGDVRSPAQITSLQFNGTLDDPEIVASIPGGLLNSIRPLYYQMLEAASISDDFDSRNDKGQTDQGGRGNHSILDLNNYDNWTRAELDEAADRVVPFAMRATAELFRYFYSRVDPTPPELEVLGLSPTAAAPTIVTTQPGEPTVLKFLGVDIVSGIDLDGYDLSVSRFNDTLMAWEELVVRPNLSIPGGGIGMESIVNLPAGLYRAMVANDNGGGLRGQSPFAYFQLTVVPEPTTLSMASLAVAATYYPRRRRASKTPSSGATSITGAVEEI